MKGGGSNDKQRGFEDVFLPEDYKKLVVEGKGQK